MDISFAVRAQENKGRLTGGLPRRSTPVFHQPALVRRNAIPARGFDFRQKPGGFQKISPTSYEGVGLPVLRERIIWPTASI